MSDTLPTLPYSTEILQRQGRGFETDDIFNHKPFAEFLQVLLDDTNEPKTVAIHGAWGSGKTVFVEMWKEHMEDKEFSVIYFDAFKHDYQSDAFLSLTKALCMHFKDNDLQEFKDKTKKIASILLKNLASTVSRGVINTEAIDAIYNNCEKEEEIINDFKETLSQLTQRKNKDKPLIFIIDELDRCRPDFALEILEKVKHVFNTLGLHFIFAVNFDALENSVQKTYGVGKQYLQKFFKFSLILSQNTLLPNRKELFGYEGDHYHKNTNSYISHFFEKLKNEKPLSTQKADAFINFYKAIVSTKDSRNESFTIRDFQRTHDYLLFGTRRLAKDKDFLNEINEYHALLKHYSISVENSDLFNKLRKIVYQQNRSISPEFKAIQKNYEEEKKIPEEKRFNIDPNDYYRNKKMKTHWDIIESMKYLLFSESTSSSPDRRSRLSRLKQKRK